MKPFDRTSLLAASLLVAGAATAAPRVAHHTARSGHLVGPAAAGRSAARSVPGHVLNAKLENEDGKLQYAVMVRSGKAMHEVMVDAHTGRVASQERVTAAEEAREAAAESKATHRVRHARAAMKTAHSAKG